jgi:Asp-tRNA(Asn)/Glu-tRNA(Gln) amidotransferase A subunit family amidase
MSRVDIPPLPEGMPSSLVEAVRLRESGALSPLELVQQCLSRIDALDSQVRAWVEVDSEHALTQARHQMRLRPQQQASKPLLGIAIGIKDIIDVAGLRTRCGSRVRDEHIADVDAPIVAALRELGAIILGKTETTQFACSDPSPARNPWNTAHSPGGSSAGSAAATASGMCFAALGTQTGGSITRPATFCGVASFKGSWGRWPLTGIVPVSEHLDHVGPHARRVADLALLWTLLNERLGLAHASSRAAQARAVIDDTWMSHSAPPRFALIEDYYALQSDPAAYSTFTDSVAVLRDAGAEITPLKLPPSFVGLHDSHRIIMAVEAAGVHRFDYARDADAYHPRISALIEEGLTLRAVEYRSARAHQQRFRSELRAALRAGGTPAIALCPATVNSAPPFADNTTGDAKFNVVWSFAGLPTCALPSELSSNGLPLGLQLGAPAESFGLFQAAAWCERVVDFPSLA